MKPTVRRLETEYAGRVDFTPMNIDLAESKAARDKYRFIGQPQFVIVAANGAVITSRNGYQAYETLKADLDSAIQTP